MPPGRAEDAVKGLCMVDFRTPSYLTSPTTLKKLRMDAQLEVLTGGQLVAASDSRSTQETAGWPGRLRQNDRCPAQLVPQPAEEPEGSPEAYDPDRLVKIVRQGLPTAAATDGVDWRRYVREEAGELLLPTVSRDAVTVTNRLICCRLIEDCWEMPNAAEEEDDRATATNRVSTALTEPRQQEINVLQQAEIDDRESVSIAIETTLSSTVPYRRTTSSESPRIGWMERVRQRRGLKTESWFDDDDPQAAAVEKMRKSIDDDMKFTEANDARNALLVHRLKTFYSRNNKAYTFK